MVTYYARQHKQDQFKMRKSLIKNVFITIVLLVATAYYAGIQFDKGFESRCRVWGDMTPGCSK